MKSTKTKIRILFYALFGIILGLLSVPNIALAGWTPGSGGGSSSGPGSYLRWVVWDPGDWVDIDLWQVPAGWGGSAGRDHITPHTNLLAYVDYKSYSDLHPDDYMNGWSWVGWYNSAINFELPGNWGGASSACIPSELRDPNVTNVNIRDENPVWYNADTGQAISAIWADPNLNPQWEHRPYDTDVIVWAEEGTYNNMQVTVNYWDCSLEDKWYAPKEASYEHTTAPGDTVDTYYVNAWVQHIHCDEWWLQYPDGHWTNDYFDYSLTDTNEYHKTIHYNVSIPSIEQEYYAPLNANRQGYAEVGDSDITRNYVGGKKLDASVTNAQNRSDNSYIETLDLNADTNFTLTFNNDVLGLDASKNWNNSPPELKNGDWEYVEGATYANGRILPGDDYYRYDLALNAAISTDISKKGDNGFRVVKSAKIQSVLV